VTASIGVATATVGGSDLDALKRRAAVALDRAKAKGRNNHVVCLQLPGEEEPDLLALETALRRAIARRELRLVYQPQVDIASGTIIGVEALLRWDHPVLGAVSPDRFIPVAEEAGLIGEIGDWVCRTACATASRWQHAGLPPVRTMINLSAYQVQQGGLAARIEAILAETGLEPCRFGVEITESVLIQELDEAVQELSHLRDLGVKVALDDFGTGYSSLSYLRRLPLDVVKIDRSLVPAVTGDSDALSIARAIVAMSHSLGLKVMAEGVENEGQLKLLAANRCDHFQGYHFSQPVAAAEVEVMLRNGRRLAVPERHRSAQACAVLAVAKEPVVTERLRQDLHWHFGEQVQVETCNDSDAAARVLGEHSIDLIISDLSMPHLDGLALMNEAVRLQPGAVRMMLLDHGEFARVVEDLRQVDVFRYLSKPWRREALCLHVEAALDKVILTRGDRAPKERRIDCRASEDSTAGGGP